MITSESIGLCLSGGNIDSIFFTKSPTRCILVGFYWVLSFKVKSGFLKNLA